LPDAYGSPSYYPYRDGTITGCWCFQLLPFLEQDSVLKSTIGPLVYSSSYHQVIDGQVDDYNDSFTYPNPGYQAQRAKGRLKVFLSPQDPTVEQVESPSSYLANWDPIWNYMTFDKITDGLSNTTFFSEGYARCGYRETYYGYTNEQWVKRSWNNDPFYSKSSYEYDSSTSTSKYTEETSAPTYYPWGHYSGGKGDIGSAIPFQIRPRVTECFTDIPQGLSSGGVLVAMGDGSVRLVSSSVSMTT